MKLKLDNTTIIRTEKNDSNKGLFPIGMFHNSIYLWHKGEEYYFYPKFTNDSIKISDLFQSNESNSITKHIKNYDREFRLSKFKINLLKYLLNQHKLNYKFFDLKRNIYDRRKTIFSFGVAGIGGVLYFVVNFFNENILMKLISSNLYVQSFIFFMTIIGIMKIYRPFAIKKGFSDKDAEEIYEKKKKDDDDRKRSEEMASF